MTFLALNVLWRKILQLLFGGLPWRHYSKCWIRNQCHTQILAKLCYTESHMTRFNQLECYISAHHSYLCYSKMCLWHILPTTEVSFQKVPTFGRRQRTPHLLCHGWPLSCNKRCLWRSHLPRQAVRQLGTYQERFTISCLFISKKGHQECTSIKRVMMEVIRDWTRTGIKMFTTVLWKSRAGRHLNIEYVERVLGTHLPTNSHTRFHLGNLYYFCVRR